MNPNGRLLSGRSTVNTPVSFVAHLRDVALGAEVRERLQEQIASDQDYELPLPIE